MKAMRIKARSKFFVGLSCTKRNDKYRRAKAAKKKKVERSLRKARSRKKGGRQTKKGVRYVSRLQIR